MAFQLMIVDDSAAMREFIARVILLSGLEVGMCIQASNGQEALDLLRANWIDIILTDQKMEQTDLGVIALSCAATDDVTAWCLLAFVVGVAQAQIGSAVMVAVLTAVYVAIMFFAIRPLAVKWVAWAEPRGIDRHATPLLFIAVLCSALITEAIGIHAVFGAFLLGAVIPHDSRVAQELSSKLHDVVTILLLPAFFAIEIESAFDKF